MSSIKWRRESPTMISWILENGNGVSEYHANRYATFVGPATGQNIYSRQVHGYASSPQRSTIGATSAALRQKYNASSVRHTA